MIPLRIRANFEGDGTEPFVTKVLCSRDGLKDERVPYSAWGQSVAELVAELPGELVFASPRGYLRLPGAAREEIDGDVLFVDPARSIAHRWIRAASAHNTLLVTERCDQLCVMCSQPPKDHHVDLFGFFMTAAALAPGGAVIGLSGGEPTLYKEQLFALIRSVWRHRPDTSFHILTNAQHFAEEDLRALRQEEFARVLWGIPLYAADADTHDTIVGKKGAFERLLQSFSVLLQAGVSVELRTVIMRQNYRALPSLARFTTTHLGFVRYWALMQLESIGFARRNWNTIFVDHGEDFGPISAAIDIAISRGVDAQLYNCPLCTIPPQYRELACRSISDWKQKYLPACKSCGERQRCSGFFEWYDPQQGYGEVRPL